MRKFFPLIIAGIMLASGCLKSKVAEDPDTIVVWEQEDSTVAVYIDSVFDAFKKLPGNEHIRIVRVHYNNEDLRQQFQTASIAGSPPDLIMTPSDPAGVYAVSGFILPVGGVFDMSVYNDAVVNAVTLDGKIWGVPTSNGNHLMMMYNKKLVKKLPETLEDLYKYCDTEAKTLKLDYCMALNMGEPYWMMPWLGGFGGWPIDNRTPTLDNKPMRDAVNFYMDIKYNRKYVPAECDYNAMDSLFKEGKVAFIVNGDWAISTYSDFFKGDFGVGRIPKIGSTGLWPSPMISGKYFMLSARLKGARLELVKKLVSFYTNKENQIKQVEVLKRLPALKEANDAPAVLNDPLLRGSMEELLVGKPMPMATEMRAVWDSSRHYLGNILEKRIAPDEGITKMQQDAQTKIREMDR